MSAAEAAPALTGIVVQWGDPGALRRLVAAWPDDPRFELVVVDNGGPAGGIVPGELGSGVRVVRPGRNLGFAGGVEAGVAATRADLLLVLNPDAVPEPGALERLLEGFAAEPRAAGLVPRLVGADGASQARWQLRGLPRLHHLLFQALGVPAAPEAATEPPAGTPIVQPAAAALALRREALEAVGGFDPAFHPAWFEDVDLAARLAAAGRRLLYHPAAVFAHRQGATVEQLGYGRFLWTYQRNLVRYLGKHHGAAAAAAGRLLLPVGHLLRLALLPLRRPRRAESRRQAAAGLLAAGLGAVSGWRRPSAWAAAVAVGGSPAGGSPPAASRAAAAARRRGLAGSRQGGVDGEGSPGPARRPPPRPAPAGEAIAVCIVTHDDEADVEACLAAVAASRHRPLEVVVADCASRDESVAAAERERGRLRAAGVGLTVVALEDNRGFAGGMNAAFAASSAPWVLTLNADAAPEPSYVGRLLARAFAHPALAVGAVTGRLVRPAADGVRRLDACGMRLTRTWRHLDRGSSEPDRGQFAVAERVFGGTGAATLFRRAALEDAAVDGEVLDPRFHTYREDAELAFRLRERGWEVLYEPTAVAEHRRRVLPERRRHLSAYANYHSLKNRYLLRLYHQTTANLLPTLVPATARDLMAFAYVLLRERSSLPAYGWLWRHRREIVARRRVIQGRRRVPARDLDRWFGRSGLPL
jgi:GT2 family glycosyltransferase